MRAAGVGNQSECTARLPTERRKRVQGERYPDRQVKGQEQAVGAPREGETQPNGEGPRNERRTLARRRVREAVPFARGLIVSAIGEIVDDAHIRGGRYERGNHGQRREPHPGYWLIECKGGRIYHPC